MNKTYDILLAGFGGQGILFSGKVVAYAGMENGSEVSWIPSYGPEMRGGTCNCSVVVSDDLIGCPIVTAPSVLVAMNAPSLLKFEKAVKDGGVIIVDETLVPNDTSNKNAHFFKIPATAMAKENGFAKLANMIILGKMLKETNFVSYDVFMEALKKVVPKGKEEMLEQNKKAVDLGYNY